jgi:DNA-binding NarL/FixJ family response regulator
MKKVSILIVEDHRLVREIWSFILNSDPRFEVIAETQSGIESIELARQLRPDVVMMDINLPDISGIDATRQIRKFCPAAKILAISLHSLPSYAKEIMKNGAMGYVTKTSAREEMLEAIMEIYNGEKYICRQIKHNLIDQMLLDVDQRKGINALTRREIQIINLIKKGSSSKDIAGALVISAKTVEVHRHKIMKKLDVRNTSALVNFIHSHHLFN